MKEDFSCFFVILQMLFRLWLMTLEIVQKCSSKWINGFIHNCQ